VKVGKRERNNAAQWDNNTNRKCQHLESNGYALNKGNYLAVLLHNTQGMAKIKSYSHTSQYAGSVSFDHS